MIDALDRLSGDPRHAQRDLHIAADMWFRHGSCLKQSFEGAWATDQGIETVATYLDHADEHVAIGAIHALRSAATAHSLRELVGPWCPPGVMKDIHRLVGGERVLSRLNAVALVGDFPSLASRGPLRAALSDPLWTVRWYAVIGLANLGQLTGLAEVLDASRPSQPGKVVFECAERALLATLPRQRSD